MPANNAEAMEDLVKNQGVMAAPAAGRRGDRLREVTVQMLDEDAAKDPLVKKVHDCYMGFKKRLRTTGPACPKASTTRRSADRSSSACSAECMRVAGR